MFVAPTFQAVGLGGHGGILRPGYKGGLQIVNLVLLHLHYTCYMEEVANTWTVMTGHGYLHQNMTHDAQVAKCKGELAQVYSSRHKIALYCGHLKDPAASQAKIFPAI